VDYKRALNRKYRPEAAALRLFDRYLCEREITGWDSIDSILIERFLQSRPRTRPRSYNHLLGVIRRFFDWAVLQRFIVNNPVQDTSRRNTGKHIPYLFTLNDAKRLLDVVRTLPDRSRALYRALTYETIFALLYVAPATLCALGGRGPAPVGVAGGNKIRHDQLTAALEELKGQNLTLDPVGEILAECASRKGVGAGAEQQGRSLFVTQIANRIGKGHAHF
jgi:hypothetical protein